MRETEGDLFDSIAVQAVWTEPDFPSDACSSERQGGGKCIIFIICIQCLISFRVYETSVYVVFPLFSIHSIHAPQYLYILYHILQVCLHRTLSYKNYFYRRLYPYSADWKS